VGKIKFHPGDMPISGPVAEEAYRQLQLGVLGVSIGFAPTEYDLNDLGGVDYTKIELLETSIVSVPCNPEALLVDLSKPEEDTKEDDEETEGMDEEEIEGSATIPDKKEVAPTKVKSPYNEALKLYFEYLD
jgi:phage head maturation protease